MRMAEQRCKLMSLNAESGSQQREYIEQSLAYPALTDLNRG